MRATESYIMPSGDGLLWSVLRGRCFCVGIYDVLILRIDDGRSGFTTGNRQQGIGLEMNASSRGWSWCELRLISLEIAIPRQSR